MGSSPATAAAAAAATAATHRAPSRAIAAEPGLSRAACVSAAVVCGDDLDVLMAREAIPVLVLDAGVGEANVPVVVRQIVFARPTADLFRLPIWSTIAVRPTAIAFLEEALVVALQFVVEDDATEAPTLVSQAVFGALVGAIDLDVVRQLSRLPDTGMEGLPRFVEPSVPWQESVRLEQIASAVRQGDRAILRIECRPTQ